MGVLICLFANGITLSQNNFVFDSASIAIKALNINTNESEFSPFVIGSNFYFTSSRERQIGFMQMDKFTNHQLLDIYSGVLVDSTTVKNISVLSNKINNAFNQGSGFFDKKTSMLYYSGDLPIQDGHKKYKLAIFSSAFINNEFQTPKVELALTDTFSVAHPMVYNGKLYFSSNMLGGKGKTDIYCAEKVEGKWTAIKNCHFLNSSENDYFPYILNSHEIYFSSDRPGGFGKLDLYKFTFNDSSAIIQNLGQPINSTFDDFSICIDSTQERGYLSSNRKNEQDDIYFFKQTWPVFKNCKNQVIEDYCYNLTEESALNSDSLKGYYYEWLFGDGTEEKGLEVRHCFPGPGKYLIKLNIIDSVTQAVFMNQTMFDLKVDSIIQLKINCLDTILQNRPFTVNTDLTYLPENKINAYYFDVDGKRLLGETHECIFADKGKHTILLGITTTNTKTLQKQPLCTSKDVVCVDSLTWLKFEERQIQKIIHELLSKKSFNDSMFTTFNYIEEEIAFNKRGLNGALAVSELKKLVKRKYQIKDK